MYADFISHNFELVLWLLYLTLSQCLSLSFTVSVSLCLCLCLSKSLFLSVFFSLCLSLWASLCTQYVTHIIVENARLSYISYVCCVIALTVVWQWRVTSWKVAVKSVIDLDVCSGCGGIVAHLPATPVNGAVGVGLIKKHFSLCESQRAYR